MKGAWKEGAQPIHWRGTGSVSLPPCVRVSSTGPPDRPSSIPLLPVSSLARSFAYRFAYATGPLMNEAYTRIAGQQQRLMQPAEVLERSARLPPRESAFRPVTEFPFEEDAFGTIMQWLYHRINETR